MSLLAFRPNSQDAWLAAAMTTAAAPDQLAEDAYSARAFAELVELYWEPIATYVRRMCGDADLAHDLTQDTFVRAYRALAGMEPGPLVRPWLYRIATNLTYNAIKRRRRFGWLPIDVLDHIGGHSFHASVEERDLIEQVFETLRPDERAVLLLCGADQMTYALAAEALCSRPDAVRKQFARSAERFRRAYVNLARDRVRVREPSLRGRDQGSDLRLAVG
jgi:RNA polymerase sigma-70 factor (ECF subfamily)